MTSFLESKGVAPQCVRLQFVKEEGNKKRTGAAWVELASADAAKAAAELKITVEGAEEPLSIQLKSALQDAKKVRIRALSSKHTSPIYSIAHFRRPSMSYLGMESQC